jgi:hypothetical protein
VRGYWKFDGTTAADASGHGHTATLLGGTFTADGKYDGCVTLAGTAGAYVVVPSLSAPSFPPGGTFAVWFLWTSMSAPEEDSVLGSYDRTLHQLKDYAPSQTFRVGQMFAGKIDELRLYDRALGDVEAAAPR